MYAYLYPRKISALELLQKKKKQPCAKAFFTYTKSIMLYLYINICLYIDTCVYVSTFSAQNVHMHIYIYIYIYIRHAPMHAHACVFKMQNKYAFTERLSMHMQLEYIFLEP